MIKDFIFKLFSKEIKQPPISRTYNKTSDLTKYEEYYIFVKKKCPDCEVGDLIPGQEGGGSQNFYCENCTSKFNLTEYGLFNERISDSSLKNTSS